MLCKIRHDEIVWVLRTHKSSRNIFRINSQNLEGGRVYLPWERYTSTLRLPLQVTGHRHRTPRKDGKVSGRLVNGTEIVAGYGPRCRYGDCVGHGYLTTWKMELQ